MHTCMEWMENWINGEKFKLLIHPPPPLSEVNSQLEIPTTSAIIIALLVEDVDSKKILFWNLWRSKERITMNLETTIVEKKKDKLMKKLVDQFGDKREKAIKGDAPLQLTQDKGEDEETVVT